MARGFSQKISLLCMALLVGSMSVSALKQASALEVFGQTVQLISEMQKKETVTVNLLDLVVSAAHLPGVQEGSMLFLFKKGMIRANQEVLLNLIIADKAGREALTRDFCAVLRTQGSTEVQALIDVPAQSGLLAKIYEELKCFFGDPNWREAFISWFNFVVDSTQDFLNICIDMTQQQLGGLAEQYGHDHAENPIIGAVVSGADVIAQQQIDNLQQQVNQAIDEAQQSIKG